MTQRKPKILMVEDDMIIATDISMQLTQLGYDVIGISTHAEDALQILEQNTPDLIIMDIVLSGSMNGIDASILILEKYQVPIIFLTSNTDDATFQKALVAKPYAFISKPFQKSELERIVKITLERIENNDSTSISRKQDQHTALMEDRLFVRHKNKMARVIINEIHYAMADGNYTKIVTNDQTYIVSLNSKQIELQLPTDRFIRVHRSYIVNLQKIDSISEYQEYLYIGKIQIPISRRLKKDILKHLKLI